MEPCLSVVIPVFNERATIDEVLAKVLAQPATREIVVVDDASTDGTREHLATLTDPRVRVLFQPFNLGKGAALRRGFEAATSPFVIVQDADLEYDPADFDILLGPLLDGRADVVFGSRFISGGAHRVLYYWHSVGNRLLTTASNVATNLNLTDMETCYKAFRREVIQSIELREDRFGFEPEVTAKIAAGGWRVYEVGVSYHGRTYAEGKKIGWRDGVRALYCVARYSRPGRAVSGRVRAATLDARPAPPAPARVVAAPGASARGEEHDWVVDLIEPWLGNRVVVLGEAAAAVGDVLVDRFAGRLDVRAAAGLDDLIDRGRPDTFVLVSFLEGEPDPAATLARLRSRLAPGGRIVLLVRGGGVWARAGGLDRPALRRSLAAAELRPEVLRPVPLAGAAAGGRWDRAVVPVLRTLDERLALPVGLSLFCVASPAFAPVATDHKEDVVVLP